MHRNACVGYCSRPRQRKGRSGADYHCVSGDSLTAPARDITSMRVGLWSQGPGRPCSEYYYGAADTLRTAAGDPADCEQWTGSRLRTTNQHRSEDSRYPCAARLPPHVCSFTTLLSLRSCRRKRTVATIPVVTLRPSFCLLGLAGKVTASRLSSMLSSTETNGVDRNECGRNI